MKIIVAQDQAGKRTLHYIDSQEPILEENQVLLDVTAIGVNFQDISQVIEDYTSSQESQFTPGLEVVGTTPLGKRVLVPLTHGGYSQKIAIQENDWIDIPIGVSDIEALSTTVHGLTAWHALKTMGRIQQGETVVVHAAAGGVGSWAVQLAKMWGAYVIAVTSNSTKSEVAKKIGADAFVDPHEKNLSGALIAANNGKKIDLILEMVGGNRFNASYEAMAPFGRLVTYGMISQKPANEIRPSDLIRGSKTISGLWLGDCDVKNSFSRISELLKLVENKVITPVIGEIYPLSQAHLAHSAILARVTTGKVSLDPLR